MKFKALTIAALSVGCLFAQAAIAVGPPALTPPIKGLRYVNEQYIITLKAALPGESRIIPEPDIAAKDRPGFVPSAGALDPIVVQHLEAVLQLRGKITDVYDTINAVAVLIDAQEAERISHHPLVQSVEQNYQGQIAVGALPLNPQNTILLQDSKDRIDQAYGQYDRFFHWWSGQVYTSTQWSYILDTGVAFNNTAVMNEFSDPVYPAGRVINFWNAITNSTCPAPFTACGDATDDNTWPNGSNWGHGTMVASTALGNVSGVGKREFARIIKVATAAGGWNETNLTAVFNWLTSNAVRGSVVNMSLALDYGSEGCPTSPPASNTALENAMVAAYQAGVIIINAAGNDGCDASNTLISRLPEVFTVGGTVPGYNYISNKWWEYKAGGLVGVSDASSSRWGAAVDMWAPWRVYSMGRDGLYHYANGTSFASPTEAGMVTVWCQTNSNNPCGNAPAALPGSGYATIYDQLRGDTFSRLNSVKDNNGNDLPVGTTSRFIYHPPGS